MSTEFKKLVPEKCTAIPEPYPAVTVLTPAEIDEKFKQKEMKNLDKEAERHDKELEEKDKKDGLVAKVVHAADHVVKEVVAEVQYAEGKASELAENEEKKKFASLFSELDQAGEKEVCGYDCSVVSEGALVKGHVLVSTKHICFHVKDIKDTIPLTDVASIIPSTVDDSAKKDLPVLKPATADTKIDSLQVYTKNMQQYTFVNVTTTTLGNMGAKQMIPPAEQLYNYLDHTWRACTKVPLDGVTYAKK